MYVVDNLYISLLPSATTIWSSFNYLSKSASWNTWNGSWPDISVQGAWQQIHNSTLYHINFTNVWSENSDLPSCNGHLVFKEIWTQQLALGEIQNSDMWWFWVLSLVLFLVCLRP